VLLNSANIEAVVFGTAQRLHSLNQSGGIVTAGITVQFVDALKLIGVSLDSTLSFHLYVVNVARMRNYHIRALRNIQPRLTTETAKSVASCIVGFRLDYYNSLLYIMSCKDIQMLKKVQNYLAGVFCQPPWSVSAVDARRSSYWLPIQQQIQYKMLFQQTNYILLSSRSTWHPCSHPMFLHKLYIHLKVRY
jgi:hypothetical protein